MWSLLQLKDLTPSESSRAEADETMENEQDFFNIMDTKSPFAPKWNSAQNELKCKYVFFGMPGAGCSFLQYLLLLNKINTPTASIELPPLPLKNELILDEKRRFLNTTTNIYLLDNSIAIIPMEYVPHNLRHYSWIQTLLQHVQFEQCIILDQIVLANYLTNQYSSKDSIPLPLVRKLTTKSFSTTNSSLSSIGYLECPNLISGIGATLLTELQLRQQSGAVFVTLVENQGISMTSLYGFLSIWNGLVNTSIDKQVLFALQKQKPLVNKLGGIYL